MTDVTFKVYVHRRRLILLLIMPRLDNYSTPVTATSLKDGCEGCPGVGESLSIELVLADLDPRPETGGEVVPELKPSPARGSLISSNSTNATLANAAYLQG